MNEILPESDSEIEEEEEEEKEEEEEPTGSVIYLLSGFYCKPVMHNFHFGDSQFKLTDILLFEILNRNPPLTQEAQTNDALKKKYNEYNTFKEKKHLYMHAKRFEFPCTVSADLADKCLSFVKCMSENDGDVFEIVYETQAVNRAQKEYNFKLDETMLESK